MIKSNSICIIKRNSNNDDGVTSFLVQYGYEWHSREIWDTREYIHNRYRGGKQLCIYYPVTGVNEKYAILLARVAYDASGGNLPYEIVISVKNSEVNASFIKVREITIIDTLTMKVSKRYIGK